MVVGKAPQEATIDERMSLQPYLAFFSLAMLLGTANQTHADSSAVALNQALKDAQYSAQMQVLCSDLRVWFKKYSWKIDPCEKLEWKVGGQSVKGRPLVYLEMGNPDSKNTTLVFSMVHGDEITPLYSGVQLALWLVENKEQLKDARVVIAPLVNPDSFFAQPKTRTNSRGVDVNRNFKTRDWERLALSSWKKRYGSNPRRFPGNAPDSEPETIFQRDLIEKFQPQKILSIHAPLNFLDYDGPNMLTLHRFEKEYVAECLRLRKLVQAKHSHFYPGSLGNYSGRDLGIPTVTLEFPTSDYRRADSLWKTFKGGIKTMIEYRIQAKEL
jgi:protein MpaA